MALWIRGIAAFLAGGLALFWQPGLESAQNSITSHLHLSGQVVNLVWLALTFAWTFLAALVAHGLSGTLLFYLGSQRWRLTDGPSLQRHD